MGIPGVSGPEARAQQSHSWEAPALGRAARPKSTCQLGFLPCAASSSGVFPSPGHTSVNRDTSVTPQVGLDREAVRGGETASWRMRCVR